MDSQDILTGVEQPIRSGRRPRPQAKSLAWFASYAQDFGAVLLESSLSAYGRGGRTFAAVAPVDSWALECDQPIPADWMRQLNLFLADSSAFYSLFFSYDFGAELVA